MTFNRLTHRVTYDLVSYGDISPSNSVSYIYISSILEVPYDGVTHTLVAKKHSSLNN